jgi:hypothetical protein
MTIEDGAMKISASEFDSVRGELRLTVTLTEKDLVSMTGELERMVLGQMATAVVGVIDPAKLLESVTKSVITELTKQIADRFVEENGEDILEEAREALEDMVENMT